MLWSHTFLLFFSLHSMSILLPHLLSCYRTFWCCPQSYVYYFLLGCIELVLIRQTIYLLTGSCSSKPFFRVSKVWCLLVPISTAIRSLEPQVELRSDLSLQLCRAAGSAPPCRFARLRSMFICILMSMRYTTLWLLISQPSTLSRHALVCRKPCHPDLEVISHRFL